MNLQIKDHKLERGRLVSPDMHEYICTGGCGIYLYFDSVVRLFQHPATGLTFEKEYLDKHILGCSELKMRKALK